MDLNRNESYAPRSASALLDLRSKVAATRKSPALSISPSTPPSDAVSMFDPNGNSRGPSIGKGLTNPEVGKLYAHDGAGR
jgi:hypothetical protein